MARRMLASVMYGRKRKRKREREREAMRGKGNKDGQWGKKNGGKVEVSDKPALNLQEKRNFCVCFEVLQKSH